MIDPSAIYQAKIEEINQLLDSKRALLGKNQSSSETSFKDSLDASMTSSDATAADDLSNITYADSNTNDEFYDSSAYRQAAQSATGTTSTTDSSVSSMQDDMSSMMSTMMQLMQSSMSMSSMSSLSGGGGGGGGNDMMSGMMSMLMMNMMMKMMTNMTENASEPAVQPAANVQAANKAYTATQETSNVMLEKAAQYDQQINAAAEKYNVSPYLIKGVIQAESSFNPNSVSGAGAKGLMQLMDGTAESVGVTNPFDPAQNIDGATNYLAQMLDRFDGDLRMALSAYNCGPTRVANTGAASYTDPRYQSVPQAARNYADKVISYAQGYAQAYSRA